MNGFQRCADVQIKRIRFYSSHDRCAVPTCVYLAHAAYLSWRGPPVRVRVARLGSTSKIGWDREILAGGAAWASLRTCRAMRMRGERFRAVAARDGDATVTIPRSGRLEVTVRSNPDLVARLAVAAAAPSTPSGECAGAGASPSFFFAVVARHARAGPDGAAGRMFTWSYCNVCSQHATPLVAVSRGALQVRRPAACWVLRSVKVPVQYSFGKFLEQSFYNRRNRSTGCK